jgi:uncharacterized membrane protein
MAQRRHLHPGCITLSLAFVLTVAAVAPAHADVMICNRMSYIVTAAIGLEDKTAAATRGWFRIDPGDCRTVLLGGIEATSRLLVHAEALPIYGAPPLPQHGQADLCISHKDFIIPAARVCTKAEQRLARFTEVKPSTADKGQAIYLAEEAGYDDEQARLAGIQRLLVLAGYDANPVDGIDGLKTQAAIASFAKDHKLAADAVKSPAIFEDLLQAARQPDAVGFAWCNETSYPVMAALGVETVDSIVTRGWYRVEAGRCLHPELRGKPRKLFSYGEAVDAGGHVVTRGGKRLVWGGTTLLCTRNVRFELSEHADCLAMGLTATGFAALDPVEHGPAIVNFRIP